MSFATYLDSAYLSNFGDNLSDQDKTRALHQVCKTCVEYLQQWSNRKRNSLKFIFPMFCRDQKPHRRQLILFSKCN